MSRGDRWNSTLTSLLQLSVQELRSVIARAPFSQRHGRGRTGPTKRREPERPKPRASRACAASPCLIEVTLLFLVAPLFPALSVAAAHSLCMTQALSELSSSVRRSRRAELSGLTEYQSRQRDSNPQPAVSQTMRSSAARWSKGARDTSCRVSASLDGADPERCASSGNRRRWETGATLGSDAGGCDR